VWDAKHLACLRGGWRSDVLVLPGQCEATTPNFHDELFEGRCEG
jgi:hypothetical protein